MSDELLTVKGLKLYFPVLAGIFRHTVGYVKAVDGVDFVLRRGQTLGLVGESGSGKSSIARAILRLVEPTAGEISYAGTDLRALSKQELRLLRPKLQIVFQDPLAALNPRKTIGQTLGEPLSYYRRVASYEEEIGAVAELLTLVGLSPELMTRYPHQLSGGQQQRICIGRAIALNPEMIICDEAVSALDVSIQAQVLNLLLELHDRLQLSYIFISHDLSIVRYMSDSIVVLYLGKVMESGHTETVFKQPKHPYTQALLSAIPKSHPNEKKDYQPVRGEMPSPLHPPSGCPFRTRCPYAQPECSQIPPRRVIPDPDGGEDHVYHCILP